MREETRVWPVRVVADGVEGFTLWFEGDTDLLLTREGRIALFSSPDALADEVAGDPDVFSPSRLAAPLPDQLRLMAAAPPSVFDLDRARAWLGSPDRERTVEACDLVLNALNMASDVGASVGDARIAEAFASDALTPLHDALTFGLTLLGNGGPLRDNPDAMTEAITPASAAAAIGLLDLAAQHLAPAQA
jgi:hypothetical protein